MVKKDFNFRFLNLNLENLYLLDGGSAKHIPEQVLHNLVQGATIVNPEVKRERTLWFFSRLLKPPESL